jgi:PleD family two-component response regulator
MTVFGQYALNSSGKPQSVYLQASSGVAEHREGESAEALFARADSILYRDKAIESNRYA